MKKISTITGILALVFLLGSLMVAGNVWAQEFGHQHDGRGFWTDLTDEQKEAVEAKMKELRDNKASPEEMHAAIDEMLKGYDIEVPARDSIGPPPDMGGPGPGGFLKDLTDEQREAVEAKMKELRDNKASPEEMHAAIDEMLKGYGIEVPARDSIGPPLDMGGPGPGGFLKDLTDEQREAVEAKMKELRDNKASPEVMHAAIDEMLKGYGIEPPKGCPGPPGKGHGHGFPEGLTKEQRETIDAKIKEMRNQGATHGEIRAAVDKMIEGYGMETPGNSESSSSEKSPAENKITAGSYPNPFNPETRIAYTLNAAGKVRIQIYNITGQLIRVFDQGYQSTGNYVVNWDGRSENGDMTASGVYLYRIEAGSYHITNRMVLLK
jgi:Spy/CpxP family protein refolding chaperone